MIFVVTQMCFCWKKKQLIGTTNLDQLFHTLVTVWNDLPLDVWKSSSISLFKKRLKIHFFNMAFVDVPNID